MAESPTTINRALANEAFFEGLAARGIACCYDSMFGNDYYCLTPAGETAFYGE